jgi:hypothetical protein
MALVRRIHERHIDHGGLVHHEEVAVERIVLVLGEATVLWIDLQQAVDRLGLKAGLLGHALGGTTCGSGQQHPDTLGDEMRRIESSVEVLPTLGRPVITAELGGQDQPNRLPAATPRGSSRLAPRPKPAPSRNRMLGHGRGA